MHPILVGLILFTIMLVFLFVGAMISLAMAATAIVGIFLFLPISSLPAIGNILWSSMFNFVLVCAPLFLLMSYLVSNGRLNEIIFKFFSSWLGRSPGGLVIAVLAGTCAFGAATGSAVADAAALSIVAYPEMEKRKYNKALSAGALAAGGTVGILMPPSITMILYSAMTGVSVGHLFLGGVIPALLMASVMMGITVLIAVVKPGIIPKDEPVPFRDKIDSTLKVLPLLLLFYAIIYSIWGGLATPTEAAAIGAFGALILVISYRRFKMQILKDSLFETIKVTSFIFLIVASASMIIYILSYYNVAGLMTKYMTEYHISRWVILGGIYVLMIILGTLVESVSLIVLTTPLLFPSIVALGFNPIWFGVIFTILIQIGLITPPVGLNLYVINSTTKVPIEQIAKGCIPYLIGMLITLILCTYFSGIILWLPSQMLR